MLEIVTLDRTSNSAYININGVNHLFSSYDNFKNLTGYSFDAILVSYEPERNIFIVERPGGVVVSGKNLEEILWVEHNKQNIIQAAKDDGYGVLPLGPTLSQIRDQKLYDTDWLVTRHRDQIESNSSTTLDNVQYQKLLNYRQQLRDITLTYKNVDDVVWPILDI